MYTYKHTYMQHLYHFRQVVKAEASCQGLLMPAAAITGIAVTLYNEHVTKHKARHRQPKSPDTLAAKRLGIREADLKTIKRADKTYFNNIIGKMYDEGWTVLQYTR